MSPRLMDSLRNSWSQGTHSGKKTTKSRSRYRATWKSDGYPPKRFARPLARVSCGKWPKLAGGSTSTRIALWRLFWRARKSSDRGHESAEVGRAGAHGSVDDHWQTLHAGTTSVPCSKTPRAANRVSTVGGTVRVLEAAKAPTSEREAGSGARLGSKTSRRTLRLERARWRRWCGAEEHFSVSPLKVRSGGSSGPLLKRRFGSWLVSAFNKSRLGNWVTFKGIGSPGCMDKLLEFLLFVEYLCGCYDCIWNIENNSNN